MLAMHSQVTADAPRIPKVNRNKTVSTKLSQSECAEAERAAAGRGQWLSEWVRDVILRELKDQNANLDLVSEIIGLQLLLMNVLAPLARGERISAEQFQGIVKSIQATKVKAAEEMLARRRQPKEG